MNIKLIVSSILLALGTAHCGADDSPSDKGVNCYDDVGDYNNDGDLSSLDCIGPTGDPGPLGQPGSEGAKGDQGVPGDSGSDGINGTNGIDGANGTNGEDGDDYVPPSDLQGFYTFPNGGYIELIANDDGEIIIYGTQRLYTVNFDSGLALHPNLPSGPHNPKSGLISGEYNGNYSTSTNDVEVDGTSSNISGYQRTYYKIWLDNDLLNIKLLVYSDSGLVVDVNRTLVSD